MSNILPANRVAAIAAFLTGLGAAISGIENALPTGKWQNAAVAAVGFIGSIVTCLHFMSGSQKYDALVARSADAAAATPIFVQEPFPEVDPNHAPEYAGFPDEAAPASQEAPKSETGGSHVG